MSASNSGKGNPRSIARLAATVVLVGIFALLIWTGARVGFASLLTAYAAKSNLIDAANKAVTLSPGDPDAHLVRGSLLEANNDPASAVAEYERAASLRPDDYVLCLSLAHGRELSGDAAGAVAAARQAVALAPFYAQPRWQLGNILVRAGMSEEGFRELGLAGEGNPALMPTIIDLAWQWSHGDVQFVIRNLRPQRPETYQALAQYFRKKKEINSAVSMFIAAGTVADQDRHTYVGELISEKHFKEAYALWTIGRTGNSSEAAGVIIDPGFEQEIDLNEVGFGWRPSGRVSTVTLSLDSGQPKEGHSSLRVDFNGESDPSTPIISQLIFVRPGTHYQLRFEFRTESIISGGPPNILVTDATGNQVLGQSGALPQTTSGWTGSEIDFVSGESTIAIQIALQRSRCAQSPCPIFGRLWLDDFSLPQQ
jgi:hypothetical protein